MPPYLGLEAVGDAAGAEDEGTGGRVLETVAGADEDTGGAAVGEGELEPVLHPVITDAQTNRTTRNKTSFFIITPFNLYH